MTIKKGYVELIAWQRAMDLIEQIYRVTKSFPKDEQYGLTAQMRRSALSVASNIAEGHSRRSAKDFGRFLEISHGSLNELETQILVSQRLAYIDSAEVDELINQTSRTGRVLHGLTLSLRRKPQNRPGPDARDPRPATRDR